MSFIEISFGWYFDNYLNITSEKVFSLYKFKSPEYLTSKDVLGFRVTKL